MRAAVQQQGFDLEGGFSPRDRKPIELRASLARQDEMPPGPYSVGHTKVLLPDGGYYDDWPYTIVCGDGRAVAGHINCKDAADKIADALNKAHPA